MKTFLKQKPQQCHEYSNAWSGHLKELTLGPSCISSAVNGITIISSKYFYLTMFRLASFNFHSDGTKYCRKGISKSGLTYHNVQMICN